jgi:predicted MFS family arabinose efflux permease
VPIVLSADVTMAVLGAVFAPTVAALTMGLTPAAALARRFGRNAAFDKAGNVFIAVVAALAGTALGQEAVFWLVPLFGAATIPVILHIPASAIDHARARGLDPAGPSEHPAPLSLTDLLRQRKVLVLALIAASFHFANAPMANMVSQKLALAHPGAESALTSATVMIAQLATIPTALLLARSERVGRKPFLLLALAALPARGLLFAATDNPAMLLAGQILDGIGAGLFDALLPLLLADIVVGSGRYTMTRGFIGTVQGIGGSLSNVFAGVLIVEAGYNATFVALAAIAVLVLAAGYSLMPETLRRPIDPASTQ